YLCALYRDEDFDAALDDEAEQALLLRWVPYLERLRARGRLVAAAPLSPSGSATTLRTTMGRPALSDGPFAQRREQIAACFIVRARDQDEAVVLARDCPELGQRAIEVRPIRELSESVFARNGTA